MAEGAPPALPARLLIDLPNWLGDLVMALPAVARVVEANRAGSTVIHTRESAIRFLEELFPDAVVVASEPRAAPWRAARRLCSDRGRFSVGLTLRHADRAKLLLFLAARRSIGSASGPASRLLAERVMVDRQRHQVHDPEPALARLGLAAADPAWRPSLDDDLRNPCRLDPASVALAPSVAGGGAKAWPAERFGALAARLAAAGVEPVVVVGPGEDAIAAEVVAAAGCELLVVGERLDVAGLADVLRRVRLLVGNDSGPMHLAALVGTPVVALFGPTDPARTGPLGDEHVVIAAGLECAPCLKRSCPLGHRRCLLELSLDEVESAVRRSLD